MTIPVKMKKNKKFKKIFKWKQTLSIQIIRSLNQKEHYKMYPSTNL